MREKEGKQKAKKDWQAGEEELSGNNVSKNKKTRTRFTNFRDSDAILRNKTSV